MYIYIYICVCVRLLSNLVCEQNKNSEYCAPLTSFDWNDLDTHRIGTSSIDTTCTMYVYVYARAKNVSVIEREISLLYAFHVQCSSVHLCACTAGTD